MIQQAHLPPMRKVLVVDDTYAAGFMLGKLLEVIGHQVRVAQDGVEALEGFAEDIPDVVISDINMPRMDGYELARRIRALPGADHIMLVALTGHGEDSDKILAREAGFDQHFVKPIGLDTLENLMNSLPARVA
jgi:CheY-like chemotaxis protein